MADFANAIKHDHKLFDHSESLAFVSKQSSGTVQVNVTKAHREILSVDEVLSSEGYFRMDDLAFHLPGTQVPATNPPKMGDEIVTSTGTRYEILRATLDEFEVDWRCVSRKAR